MHHKQINNLLKTIYKHLPLIIISIVIIVTIIAMPSIIGELTKHTHAYGEWERFRDPSCSEQGIDRRFCDCGDIQEVSIDKLDHSPGEWIVDLESNEKKLMDMESRS